MVGYCRVSTVGQAEHGYSLTAQRSAIRSYALTRGWRLGWAVDAGKSARNLHRPGLEQALALLKAGQADGLIVARLDRLSRSLIDFGSIVQLAGEQEWKLVCIDPAVDLTTATGQLVANVIAAVAQWESRIIGQRVSEAIAVGKASGRSYGVPSRTPLEVAQRVHREHAAGRPYCAIARDLNREGVPTPYGRGWWYERQVRVIGGRPVRPPDAAPLPTDGRVGIERLTARERQVLRLIGPRRSVDTIAARLGVQPGTVHAHINAMLRKLDLTDRRQLVGLEVGDECELAALRPAQVPSRHPVA